MNGRPQLPNVRPVEVKDGFAMARLCPIHLSHPIPFHVLNEVILQGQHHVPVVLSAELVVAQPIMEDDRVLNRGGLWGA